MILETRDGRFWKLEQTTEFHHHCVSVKRGKGGAFLPTAKHVKRLVLFGHVGRVVEA
jgi:hypothetical protein